jgi:hypothetical protein
MLTESAHKFNVEAPGSPELEVGTKRSSPDWPLKIICHLAHDRRTGDQGFPNRLKPDSPLAPRHILN